ncbi:Galactoside 2-alpha-L-fucosyltransferase 1 [Amphibalanus amphitrite]|uniref:L-Fucosyltransferase n=1 Tax=Amphibalanus amphitrite TaxID=1232801 RepID=A0A6A4VL90_AMPAM|nr:Galactoside 2-alpha-L-fucosyltransferase 1 [Amphibalanus amphitrite]
MFEYAALLVARDKLHRPAWQLPEMAEVLDVYFDSLSIPALPAECRYNWSRIRIDALVRRKPTGKDPNHVIVDFPTAVHLFHPMRKDVLREFTFRPELRQHADRRLAELARQVNVTSPTFIGVHVRRTDYAQWLPKFVGGRLVGADFLERALALMRSRHRDALFVVISDDPEWCRREMVTRTGATDVVVAGDGQQLHPGGDLAMLTACNHSIITHGTFGFWGAYLGGGEVIKPTGYGRKKTGVEGNVRRAGLNWTWIPAFSPQTTTAAPEIAGQKQTTEKAPENRPP